METKLFVATKSFLVHDGRVLILRESSKYKDGTNAGRFDVVGGRVKPGQDFRESLLREIKEETGLDAEIGKPFFVNEWRPRKGDEQWHIVGIFFECLVKSDIVKLSEDHDRHEWIDPKDYKNYNLIPNLHPAFEMFNRK